MIPFVVATALRAAGSIDRMAAKVGAALRLRKTGPGWPWVALLLLIIASVGTRVILLSDQFGSQIRGRLATIAIAPGQAVIIAVQPMNYRAGRTPATLESDGANYPSHFRNTPRPLHLTTNQVWIMVWHMDGRRQTLDAVGVFVLSLPVLAWLTLLAPAIWLVGMLLIGRP